MQEKINTYFTADWHCGHMNVIKFDERPFANLAHMHRVLINNYCARVQPQDVCYFLGDVGLCSFDLLANIIGQLPGKKICLIGNHDRGRTSLLRIGFDAVLNAAALVIARQLVTMSHCPLVDVWREDVIGMRGAIEGECWHGESRHRGKYTVPDYGQFHLHGHIHATKKNRIVDRQFDVGVRANSWSPVSISSIESWVALNSKEKK